MSDHDHTTHNASDDTLAPAEERTIVKTRRVSCDGGGGALGHPRVFMDMGQDTSVECKYCDRIFVLSDEAKDAH